MSQDTGRLERMLDLHGCVNGGASVGVELVAGFGAGGEEDFVVIYKPFQESFMMFCLSDGLEG